MIGSRSQLGPWIVVAANKNQDKYALETSSLDYYELKQPKAMIHMIKKKIMKPQLVYHKGMIVASLLDCGMDDLS